MKYDIVFACLARDCAKTLPAFFQFIKECRFQGLTCAALIGENGSKDGSRDIILSNKDLGIGLLDTSMEGSRKNRLERMAYMREALRLDLAKWSSEARFVCVADLDSVMVKPPLPTDIKKAMSKLDNDNLLFAVSSTSRPSYYDLLAYRSERFKFITLQNDINLSKQNPFRYYQFFRDNIYNNQDEITRLGTHLVDSAFNGLCVYRFDDYLQGNYVNGNDFLQCEHVIFHKSLQADRRKMLVDDNLKITAPREHRRSNVFSFYISQLNKVVRKFN